jgi:hypothetical protein
LPGGLVVAEAAQDAAAVQAAEKAAAARAAPADIEPAPDTWIGALSDYVDGLRARAAAFLERVDMHPAVLSHPSIPTDAD